MPIELEPGMLETGSFLDSVKLGARETDAAQDKELNAADATATEAVEATSTSPNTEVSGDARSGGKPADVTPPGESGSGSTGVPAAKTVGAASPDLESVVAGLNLPGEADKPTGTPPKGEEPIPDPPSLAKALDDIQLPPHARASTASQFEKLRSLSRETIQKLEQQIREAKSTPPKVEVPKDIQQQLEELKAFREKAAAAGDPVFEEKFGVPLKAADEAIYERLRKEGATEENIENIRKLGGIEKVDVDGLYRQISSGARRFIDAQILAKEQITEQRRKAEANANQFLTQVAQEKQAEAKQREAEVLKFVQDRVSGSMDRLPQFQLKEPPPGADPNTVKQLEAYNSFVREIRTDAVKLAQSSRPEDRADMALAAASAVYYKVTTDGLRKTVSALQSDLVSLRKQLSDIKGGGRVPGARVLTGGTAAATEEAVKAATLGADDGLAGKSADEALNSYTRMKAITAGGMS